MISKILELSTAHVIQADCRLLLGEEQFSVAKFEYGLFMFVPSEDTDLTKYSEGFQKAVAFARSNGCRFILLDRDADVLDDPQLVVNDW